MAVQLKEVIEELELPRGWFMQILEFVVIHGLTWQDKQQLSLALFTLGNLN